MFRKLIIGVSLAICALASHSAQIDTSGMTDAQIAELRATAAQAAAANAKGVEMPSTMTNVASMASTIGTQMAIAAEGFAKALNIAARELGITINEFLNTPAGKITAVLIIWKVAGAAAIKMCLGTVFIFVGMIMGRVLYLRLFTKGYQKVSYNYLFGAFTGEKMVRIPKSIVELNDAGEWLILWIMLGCVLGSILFSGLVFF